MAEELIILGICFAVILAVIGCLLVGMAWLIIEFTYRIHCGLTGKRWKT